METETKTEARGDVAGAVNCSVLDGWKLIVGIHICFLSIAYGFMCIPLYPVFGRINTDGMANTCGLMVVSMSIGLSVIASARRPNDPSAETLLRKPTTKTEAQ